MTVDVKVRNGRYFDAMEDVFSRIRMTKVKGNIIDEIELELLEEEIKGG